MKKLALSFLVFLCCLYAICYFVFQAEYRWWTIPVCLTFGFPGFAAAVGTFIQFTIEFPKFYEKPQRVEL